MKVIGSAGGFIRETDDTTSKVILYSDLMGKIRKPTTELCEMSLRHGSDKCGNGYTTFYYEHLNSIRQDIKKVVEVGVSGGYSLFMWREFFPNAIIIGVDNGLHPDKIKDLEKDDKIKIIVADQSNRDDVNRVAEACDGVDIIVDDGSHMVPDQQLTLGILFRVLRPGGHYILEDMTAIKALCSNTINWGQSDRTNGTDATMHVFREYLKTHQFCSRYQSVSESAYLTDNIKELIVHFGNIENLNRLPCDDDFLWWGAALTSIIKKK